ANLFGVLPDLSAMRLFLLAQLLQLGINRRQPALFRNRLKKPRRQQRLLLLSRRRIAAAYIGIFSLILHNNCCCADDCRQQKHNRCQKHGASPPSSISSRRLMLYQCVRELLILDGCSRRSWAENLQPIRSWGGCGAVVPAPACYVLGVFA